MSTALSARIRRAIDAGATPYAVAVAERVALSTVLDALREGHPAKRFPPVADEPTPAELAKARALLGSRLAYGDDCPRCDEPGGVREDASGRLWCRHCYADLGDAD